MHIIPEEPEAYPSSPIQTPSLRTLLSSKQLKVYSQAYNNQLLSLSGLNHVYTTLKLSQQKKLFSNSLSKTSSNGQASLLYLGLGLGMMAFGKYAKHLSYKS